MILEKIVIDNFGTIQQATVNLADRGLVSIEGLNLDTGGANSNGSGKSTLINAILWCNFDDSGKDVSADDIIRYGAKYAEVTCHWLDETNGVRSTVSRYRKHPKFKNTLVVVENGVDVTKGTNDLTQHEVNRILGCDKATFEAACLAKQDAAPDIPGMTDGELKRLLEKVLPFDDLGPLHKAATANYNKQLSLVSELKADLSSFANSMEIVRQEIIEAENNFKSWDSEVLRMQEGKRVAITSLEIEIADDLAAIKPMVKIDAAITKKQTDSEAFDRDGFNEARFEVMALEGAVQRLDEEYRTAPKVCGECGQDIKDHEQHLETLRERSLSALESLNAAKSAYTAYHADYVKYQEDIAKLEGLKNLRVTTLRQIDRVEAKKARLSELRGELTREYPNPHEAALRRLQGKYSDLETEHCSTEQQLNWEQSRLPILEAVLEMYSPKGVRYHILEQVTPQLTARTNHYLNQLTDGAMKATWSTVTQLKSGEYREKFSIAISGEGFQNYGALSGGEKRKVRLACFFALQDLIASRATKSINLWCGDEIDHALDTAGLERLMNVLHEKTKTKSTILVISHNSLREWIPNGAVVVKENKISTITGYLSDD